ncbi:4-(cytidine 5'-diphospho)-2-C-methyl-D-erythritol kinase [Marivita sp. S2033]|uniref:4-(cytidine 5'-diphospho)-2-C-methyl-D-erythritol kinase n=1 Tax=Marivita sp. S2033 TaxID=3373187 RepID=UPI003982336F
MTTAIEAAAPAKVNLALHITGQRDDGYHVLDSLVVFADVMDKLTLTPASTMSLSVDGAFAEGVPADAGNLVWQAAELCRAVYDIRLTKNIPHGAGLGGGSSDAAAVLRQLERPDLASRLGADVPVCLWPGPQHMRGIGEQLDQLWSVPPFALVLINPGIFFPTADVFAVLENKTNPPMTNMPSGMEADWICWLGEQRNDLEPAAIELAPEIDRVLNVLGDAQIARMSGSGSTCFGIYPDMEAAESAAKRISSDHPDWWVRATQTLGASVS